MKNGLCNWSDVRIFLAVLREGSTLAASRKLEISQPTIARRIDALEHQTGLALFDRDTRGFHPTRSERALLPMAEAMEAAAAELAVTIQGLTAARPIRITAFSIKFSERATRIFSEFSTRHPEVRFAFLPDVRALDLLADDADIALRLCRNDPDPNLICRHISTAQFALYGDREYADRHGLPTSADDPAAHTFVSFLRDNVPRALHDWLTARIAPEQLLMSCSEVVVMDATVKSGLALGLMNVRMAEAVETLTQCFDPIPELASRHLMLISPEAYRRPEVKAFTRFFAPRYAAICK